ncbi:MAG TPA: ABC transporter substrate-binding protein [Candidatus Paceibacterota bacterium]
MKAIVWLIVIVVVIWAGWALLDKAPEAEAGPIMIGFIGPLTGDAAAYGEPERDVVALAVEEINAAGGINGRQISVIYEDGKCDGTASASAAQKLVNVDKVQAIIGGFCSSESLAAVPIAAAGKVFLFSPGSSSPDLTGINQFFARNYPSDASQGRVMADVLYAKGMRNVAFIQESKDYPLGIFKAFQARFAELGGEVVKEEFPTDSTDFRTSLTKLKAGKPDALFVDAQTPAAADRILQQVQELGWKTQILLNDAASDPALITKYAKLLEGAMFAEFGYDATNSKFAALATAYKAKYATDLPWQSYSQTYYDSVYILAEGIKAVGYEGEKLATWVRTVKDWPGASGNVSIGSDGDVVGGHSARVIMDGKATPLGQ